MPTSFTTTSTSSTPSPPPHSTGPSKTHRCAYCAKSFSTSGHLSRHVRVHTGEMNFVCSFPGCTTRCSRKDNLRQHYRLHFDIRDPEELRRQAPHKKRRKTRVQRVATVDTLVPGGLHVMSGFNSSSSSPGLAHSPSPTPPSQTVTLHPYNSPPSSSHGSSTDFSHNLHQPRSLSADRITLSAPPAKRDEDSADVLLRLQAEAREMASTRYGRHIGEQRISRSNMALSLGMGLEQPSSHGSYMSPPSTASMSSPGSAMYFSSPPTSAGSAYAGFPGMDYTSGYDELTHRHELFPASRRWESSPSSPTAYGVPASAHATQVHHTYSHAQPSPPPRPASIASGMIYRRPQPHPAPYAYPTSQPQSPSFPTAPPLLPQLERFPERPGMDSVRYR